MSAADVRMSALASERTCWAEGTGLLPADVDALTLVSEEAKRRGLEVDLDPTDVWSTWAAALEEAGAPDLAARVLEIERQAESAAQS